MVNDQSYIKIAAVKRLKNKRLAFPLSSLQAGNYIGKRVALIGDAAHTIHPMAGLGVNAGILDSAMLAHNIILNIKTGNDIGEEMALSSFDSKAKAMNYANSLAMETLKKGFEIDTTPVNFLRKMALETVGRNDAVKEWLRQSVESNPLAKVERY